MKHIQKNNQPHAYITWCTNVSKTTQADYRGVPSNIKGDLLEALIVEQGAICAYTMKRIDSSSAHIEHIKPQTKCREEAPGSDLDYENLVACYPRDSMAKRFRYGAQCKQDWWENDGANFVSPLHASCEARFRFGLDGRVAPAMASDLAASTTISVLALDHRSLTEERKRVIEEFVYGSSGDEPLSKSKAVQALTTICMLNGRNEFYEFCVAIQYALREHLKNLKKIARQRQFAQRRN